MKSNNKNIDKNIRKKIEEYEFDFSDHAWDKMESLMDPTASADDATPPSRSNFNILRNLSIMLLLLFVLYFGLTPSFHSNKTSTAAVAEAIIKNNTTATTSSESTTLLPDEVEKETETTLPKSTTTTTATNDAIKADQRNLNKTITTIKTNQGNTNKPSSPTAKTASLEEHPIDSLLLQRLSKQLTDYQDHFQSEKVYLQFDRTFFKPGEAIWFSAYVRDANSLKASPKSDIIYVELNSPNGSNLKQLTLVAKDGRVRGDFQLGEEAAGGLYTVKAYTNWQKNQDHFFERKIQVQASVLPNLRMELNVAREAYGPGDPVEAKLELKSLENKVLANYDFGYNLLLKGQVYKRMEGKTDENGIATLDFKLPTDLDHNEGLVNVSIEYKGQTESISRSVPIILKKIDLKFLPEGGDLVANISGKVAFKAVNEFGKPADIEGSLFNSNGQQVADFKSYHQGMGAFEFRPAKGEQYYAKITKPVGIEGEYKLPKTLDRGYSLTAGKVVDELLEVTIQSTEAEALTVVLRSNGQLYEGRTTIARKGKHDLKIPVDQLPIGIAQLTLFDSKEIPRAERLVFLNPDKKLDISITTDKDKYLPREKVTMTVEVKDERGLPMPGQFSLAVADDNLLTYADDKQGHILSYLLVESELKGKIEEPNFYFAKADKYPEKDQLLALDYLMMTQGWRRFNWDQMYQEPNMAMKYKGERAVVGGTVLDLNRRPVSNVALTLRGTDIKTFSDENGRFVLEDIPFNLRRQINLQLTKDHYSRNFTAHQYGADYNIILPNGYRSKPLQIERKKTPGTSGVLSGMVIDDNGETLIGATVLLKGTEVGTVTNIDGEFELKDLPIGRNEIVVSYTGYASSQEFIQIKEEETVAATIALRDGVSLDEIVVVEYKVPLVEQDNTTQGAIVTGDNIRKFASKNLTSVAASTKNLNQVNEEPEMVNNANAKIRGSRAEAGDIALKEIVAGQKKKTKRFKAESNRRQADKLSDDEHYELAPNAEIYADQAEESIVSNNQFTQLKNYAKNFKSGYYQSREFYMPLYEAEEEISIRDDFRSTIYWNPTIELDRNGTASVEFFTSDEMTTFRATLEGLATDGGIGRQTHTFYSQLPVGLDVKVPERILSGDVLNLPLTLSNNTAQTIKGDLQFVIPEALSWEKDPTKSHKLGPNESKTIYLKLKAKNMAAAKGDLYFQFSAQGLQDAFTSSLKIIPRGFPVEKVLSGRAQEKEFDLEIKDLIEGTLTAEFNCYPSVAKDLAAGLDRMLRQPYGCFEQTSSSNYPNVLVYDLLKSTNNLDQKTEKKIKKYLKAGYNRLTGFEVEGGGFDWYGRPPAHEALTAYGLLQFVDMAAVYDVSNQMLDRNVKWLLSRKDGKGGWTNSKRALHRWAGTNPVSDAFIVWALTEAGINQGIEKELNKSYQDAMQTKDPYLLALMANTLYKVGDQRAEQVMKVLLPLQREDGSWNGLSHSMTHSTGKGLLIETTALTALAILKSKVGMPQLKGAIDFISSSKSQYGFGSTQSTILAMKALVAYAKYAQSEIRGGDLALFINGKKVAKQSYKKGQEDNITFTGFEKHLRSGDNKIKVRFSKEKDGLPYDLSIKYNTRQPNSSDACLVDLKTELLSDNAKMGATIRMNTIITNLEDKAIPNTIAKVGIPAGLSLQPWQLKELQEKGAFDYYELFDGYVVFHYRGLKAGEVKNIGLDLKADIPGVYEAPASVAYLYYTNEEQRWAKPGSVRVW